MKPRLEIEFDLRQQARFLWGKPYVPGQNEFLFDHGRSAILLALSSLKLSKGSNVGMMAYNCHTVMNVISQVGCKPIFVDVNEDLTIDIEDLRKKSGLFSVLIVSHLFGFVNDIQLIKNEFPDILIIEDCAHSYGIEHLYGDFATFSLGQGKFPSLGDGGILLVVNENYLAEVRREYQQVPSYSMADNVNLFARMWINAFLYRPWLYGWLTLPMKRRRSSSISKDSIRPKKMSRGVSAMYASKKNQVAEIIERRLNSGAKRIQYIDKNVNNYAIGINAFMLVAWCDNPKLLQSELNKRGIDSATHFSRCVEWAVEFGYRYGDCPNTELLVKKLLMIPTYF